MAVTMHTSACSVTYGLSKQQHCSTMIRPCLPYKHKIGLSRGRGTSRGVRVVQGKASTDDRWPAPTEYKLWPTDIVIGSGIYNAIQGAELVFYAALVDAGFSGDWSRIGVLTPDQELLAQQAWWFILAAHSVVAVLAVRLALQAGYPPLRAGMQGLLFGSLGLYDVYLRCQQDQHRTGN